MARAFGDCDVLLRDGVGLKYFCRALGLRPGLNMNGTDYIPTLLSSCRNKTVAIFGTRRPQLDHAADKLRKAGFNLVHVEDGFQSDEHYSKLLAARPVDVVILAMGMPRQERCAAHLKQHLQHPCIIVCGGAIVDFIGGKAKRAPSALRRLGLEWTYRLLREPRRLFGRYITGGLVFVVRLLALRLQRYRPAAPNGFASELHKRLRSMRSRVRPIRLRRDGRIPPSVVLVSPGGTAGGGGMGTVSRTIAEWFESVAPESCKVLDARGEGSVLKSPIHTIGALLQLVLLRLRGAQVLHLQLSERMSFPRKALFLALGMAMGMRVIVHHHGAEFIPVFESAGALYRRTVRFVVQRADTNIVLGKPWHDFIVERVGLGNSRIELLYNSVADIEPQIAALRGVLKRAAKRTQFLILANLSPRKGISEFLQALSALKAEGMDVGATLAGGGEVERYRSEAADLGLTDICAFTGWVGRAEVLNLLASHDVMVLPSHHEGLPISILEALCAGLPVIATPVGAIPEVLQHEGNCLLVEPGNATALARAMERVAIEPGLAERLRVNGRKAYEEKFEAGKYMRSMCAIYGVEEIAA